MVLCVLCVWIQVHICCTCIEVRLVFAFYHVCCCVRRLLAYEFHTHCRMVKTVVANYLFWFCLYLGRLIRHSHLCITLPIGSFKRFQFSKTLSLERHQWHKFKYHQLDSIVSRGEEQQQKQQKNGFTWRLGYWTVSY